MIHNASSSTGNIDIDSEININSVNSILETCENLGVKKCIVTSSFRTIIDATPTKEIYDESDFASQIPQGSGSRTHPKIELEQTIQNFQNRSNENSKLEIVIMNPGQILGNFLIQHKF